MAAMPHREASAPGSKGESAAEGNLGSSFPLVGKMGSSEVSQTAPPRPQDPEEVVSPRPTNRKPKATVSQVGVESFPGDARLHHHREVFCIQLHDAIHMGQVHAHSTLVAGMPRRLPN